MGQPLIVRLEGSRVVRVKGAFIPDIRLGNVPVLDAEAALGPTRRLLSADTRELSVPELVVFVPDQGTPTLAWRQKMTYSDAEGLQRDWIFTDAATGALLGRHGLIHSDLFREIYDGKQECLTLLSQLPGDFLFQEGISLLAMFLSPAAEKGAYLGPEKRTNSTGRSSAATPMTTPEARWFPAYDSGSNRRTRPARITTPSGSRRLNRWPTVTGTGSCSATCPGASTSPRTSSPTALPRKPPSCRPKRVRRPQRGDLGHSRGERGLLLPGIHRLEDWRGRLHACKVG